MKIKARYFLFKNPLKIKALYVLFKNPLIALVFCFSANTFAQGIQDFTPEQIRSLLTPKQVSALTERQIQGLTPAQISAFTPQHIEALEESQLKAFKPDQMRGFQPSHFNVFSKNQLRSFEPNQVGAWNAPQLSGLGTRISVITEEQLTGLQPSHIKVLRDNQIRAMSLDQLESLERSQIHAFENDQIGSIIKVESFSAGNILKFHPDQIGQGLTVQQLQSFSRAQLQVLGPEYIRKLRPDHIKALGEDQIEVLKDSQLQAFRPAQAKDLSRKQIRAMSAKQLRSLNSGQLKQKFSPQDIPNLDLNNRIYGLDEKQIGYLTSSQKQDLIKQQYNGLSLRQFQALTPEQIRAIDPEVLRGLSANKLKSLTSEQMAALTPEQLNILKNSQLNLFEADKMIDEQTAESMDASEAQTLCFDIGPNGCGATTLIGGSFSNICETLLQSPLCKDVPDDKKKDCSMNDSGIVKTPYNMLWGCLKYSVGEMLKAMWGLLKWVWGNMSDADAREETGDMAGRAMDSVKLYLHSEYEKAYEDASFPGKSVKAAIAMGGSLAKLLYDSIANSLSEEVAEWSCLNTQGKSGKICSWLLTVAGTGVGAGFLLKALSKIPGLKKLDMHGKWKEGKPKREEAREKRHEDKLKREEQSRLNELRRNIDHPDKEVRVNIATELASKGDTQNLMRMAADDSLEVREAVAKGVARNNNIGRQESIEIVGVLNKSKYAYPGQVTGIMRIANRVEGDEAVTMLKTIVRNNQDGDIIASGRIKKKSSLDPDIHRRVLEDMADAEDFSKLNISAQVEIAKSAERLGAKDILRRVAGKTDDLILRRYIQERLSPQSEVFDSKLLYNFDYIVKSYARGSDKEKKIAAIDHMMANGSPVSGEGVAQAIRLVLDKSEPSVRRHLIDRYMQSDRIYHPSGQEALKSSLLPVDRSYMLQRLDGMIRVEPRREDLKKLRDYFSKEWSKP